MGAEKVLNKETVCVCVCVVGARRKRDLFGRKEQRDVWKAVKMKRFL